MKLIGEKQMEIRNRYIDEIIFKDDSLTIKETVKNAVIHGISLSYSNLSDSDLRGSNLSYSNLSGSNLSGSNLRGANIDFSCLPLWCGSKDIKIDKDQAKQLFMHVFNIGLKYFPGGLTEEQKEWVNTCHRIQDGSFPKF